MKRSFLFLFQIFLSLSVFSQTDTAKITVNSPLKRPVQKTAPAKANPSRLPVVNSRQQPDSIFLVNKDSGTNLMANNPANDSLVANDSSIITTGDTLKQFKGIDSFYAHFLQNPLLPIGKKPVYQLVQFRNRQGKDELFYLVAGLVLFLACIKVLFSRYYSNMFRLFFQPSFRQKQTREQLMQNNLPSLLLNLFFIAAGGIYLALIMKHYQVMPLSFWKLLIYTTAGLAGLYIIKFVFLSFSGWVFNVKEASGTYIFVVYLINKIIGVLLIPFILIVAFSGPSLVNVSITISLLLIVVLFVYRFFVAYIPVRRDIKVSQLHFSLYILAFEILPLLFIYKSLILYLSRTL